MTQQEQHIAVCEWMGWNTKKEVLGSVYVYRDPKGHPYGGLPPLTLDWLHECEEKAQVRFYPRRERYAAILHEICLKDSERPLWLATKEQRLEALCRTLFPERFK